MTVVEYTTAGTFTFTVPAGVTSLSVVAVGDGGCGTTSGSFYNRGAAGGNGYNGYVSLTYTIASHKRRHISSTGMMMF